MRNLAWIWAAMAMSAMLAGCGAPSVKKNWNATGGSRSDAVVKLAYTYVPTYEHPYASEDQAVELAKKICTSWGYAKAAAFGGDTRQCTQYAPQLFGSGPCVSMIVTKEYQCLDQDGSAAPPDRITDAQAQGKKPAAKK